MKSQKNIKLTIIIIFLTIITLGFGQIFAQSTLPLVVMPARNEIEVSPGEKFSLPISFYNQSDDPVSGFFKKADFIVSDDQGSPRLIENPDDALAKYSASRWANLLYDKATLPAHEKVDLQVEINVPKEAHPGGRYLAIFFQSGDNIPEKTDTDKEAGSGTALKIASLVYIKVKGPISEKAIVARFFAPIFFEYGPIKVKTDILNRGDYHISPKGVITLTNIFGGTVDQQLIKNQNIFPDALRAYENSLGQKWMLGRYKVNFIGSYGESGQSLEASTYVWVFPWRVATVIILSLIILILFISNFYKNYVKKEETLEQEIAKEKEEIEKLKQQLRKRD